MEAGRVKPCMGMMKSRGRAGDAPNMIVMAKANQFYRHVINTTSTMQLVLMTLTGYENIPKEIHPYTTQFIRIEEGEAYLIIDEKTVHLGEEGFYMIPPGSEHEILNATLNTLRLYVLYAPPNHPASLIERTQPDPDPMLRTLKRFESFTEAPNMGVLMKANKHYRHVLQTTVTMQLVMMTLTGDESVPKEVHPYTTQFIRIEEGKGYLIIDGKTINLKKESFYIIPPGSEHEILNASSARMSMYVVYAPPTHPAKLIEPSQPRVEISTESARTMVL